jgi:DNA polymerase V
MQEAVASYAARAAKKMRRQNLATAHVALFLETNSFKANEPQYHVTRALCLPVAMANTPATQAAANAIRAVWKDGYRYKKAGIILLDLGKPDLVQGDLWTWLDIARSKSPMKIIDNINVRTGATRLLMRRQDEASLGSYGGSSFLLATRWIGTSC